MRKLAVCICLLLFIPTLPAAAQAASKAAETANPPAPPAHFYRLNFVLEELDASGKPVNSRSFAMTVSTTTYTGSQPYAIVVGTKIPVATGASHSANGDKLDTEFQYIDVGVKIAPSHVYEHGSSLSFDLKVEVSSLAAPQVIAGVSEPVIRQNTWDGSVLIPIGSPTVAFKADDLDSKGSMQLEVTATQAQ